MGPAPKSIPHQAPLGTARGQQSESNMAIQCRNPSQYRRLHLSAFETDTLLATSRDLCLGQESEVAVPSPRQHPTSSRPAQTSSLASITTSSHRHLDQSRPRQSAAEPTTGPRSGTKTPADDGDVTETEENDKSGPPSKRHKLSDDGWIEEALKRGREERGAPDPHPMPQSTPPDHLWEHHTRLRTNTAAPQPQAQSSPRWLSPSGFGQSPSVRSTTLSRRPSSVYSIGSPSQSPALTHRSTTSANRRGAPSPPDDSVMGGFSDLEIGSRANSLAADESDAGVTFDQIHKVPQVVLPTRMTASASKLEQLPKQIFMRIMMYCGYKDQVLLKMCSYGLYITVDLETIPWQEKTAAILFEERNNPENFPKKPPKAQSIEDEEDGIEEDQEASRPRKTTKRKKSGIKEESSSPKLASSKTKAHIDTYGKWGCYCCYKILPAHYFEGALLEDKEGRTPKSNKLRGANTVDSDKKIDMRVEYVQILEAVTGRDLPDWLHQDQTDGYATDIVAYIRQRMKRGVDCSDLRTYYKNITRDSHLVGPIRGITPVFSPSSVPIPSISLDSIAKASNFDSKLSPRTIRTLRPTIQAQQEGLENTYNDHETYRPLYKLQGGNTNQTYADSASYTYQIRIPGNAEREIKPLLLPKDEPVSKVWLPTMNASSQDPKLEIGDVVPLRRICIPCGTKFAVYRRNCNRKIISKTDEQWWVCDCPEVRLAGRSTGCSTCGRKVIY